MMSLDLNLIVMAGLALIFGEWLAFIAKGWLDTKAAAKDTNFHTMTGLFMACLAIVGAMLFIWGALSLWFYVMRETAAIWATALGM